MDSWGAVIDCVIVNQGEGMLLSKEGGETQENTGGGLLSSRFTGIASYAKITGCICPISNIIIACSIHLVHCYVHGHIPVYMECYKERCDNR